MNKENFIEDFPKLMKKMNININKVDIYLEAFTHTSYANENGVKHYERLEFLGDAILGFLVAEHIYLSEDISEGEMTKLRANYVCTQANAEYCVELGLDKYLLLGRGAKEHNEDSQAVLADLFESFLGALYLDQGLAIVKKLLSEFLFPKMAAKEVDFINDYKSRLQEYIQAESRFGVVYNVVSEDGPPHNKTFTIAVIHDNVKLGTGSGKTKKEAEQQAAKNALGKLAR